MEPKGWTETQARALDRRIGANTKGLGLCANPSKIAWDRANLRTMGTRLRTEAAAQFDAAAASRNLTRYEAIRRFCVAVIRDPSILDGLEVDA